MTDRSHVAGLRLQTKFLLSMLLVSAGLTATTLIVVGRTIHGQVRREIMRDLDSSVLTFRNFQRQREQSLSRSAALLADLPTVRALMTTQHSVTIQDGSADLWKLSAADLFVLSDATGKVMALHQNATGFTSESAKSFLATSLSVNSLSELRTNQEFEGEWWYGGGRLFEVFVRPIFFGKASDSHLLGFLAAGYEVDSTIAHEASRIASSQVAFQYDGSIVTSTLNEKQTSALPAALKTLSGEARSNQLTLGGELFLATLVELSNRQSTPKVNLIVVKSFDQETGFLRHLNHLLLALGMSAVLIGSLLVYLISNTFTRPLKTLVEGVRALGQGDFNYSLRASGNDEVAEVTAAFAGMRTSLRKTQGQLLDSERLATIGRMASSISHDLRHSLASIVANSEFLCELDLSRSQREELYQEVRTAADRMTELLESLLEFSRTRESLRRSHTNVRKVMERAVQAVRAHPAYQQMDFDLSCDGPCEGWFDAVKLERAFQNLILNSCEAIAGHSGKINITMFSGAKDLEIFIADNGPGISADILPSLFEPFVSFGKENGTGMGLTVVQKITQDHGGDVWVESSSATGTTFHLRLPMHLPSDTPVTVRTGKE